jgi:hypothetical protein
MKIPLGSVRLSLIEAATRQTEAAIEALERGQYDVALTLAGAAEGMIQRDGLHMFAALKASMPDIRVCQRLSDDESARAWNMPGTSRSRVRSTRFLLHQGRARIGAQVGAQIGAI